MADPSASPQPTAPAVETNPPPPRAAPWWDRRFWQLALGAFVFYGATSLWLPDSVAAAVALALLLGVVSIWFIYCVTGNAEDKRDNLFTFAYAFTFGAFALLLMPVLADQLPAPPQAQAHSEGALRLMRGCVQREAAASHTLGTTLAPCPPVAPAAVPGLPQEITATGYRYAWLISVGGVTARSLAVRGCDATTKEGARLRTDARAAAALAAANPASATLSTAAEAARRSAEQAEAVATAACLAQAGSDPKQPFVEVSGGVAVPLFVVVLALIGGAVSISRRIPEFQRRNDREYVPTADEPFMPAFRVREAVVFQIMQLVSAPFLAIATLQVIEPSNLASASTLAFATGFFSETILYMIRGMVNGLKPEVTKVAGGAMVNLAGRLTWDGEPAATGFKDLRVELRSSAGGEWRGVPVNADGSFTIPGVASGTYQLSARGDSIAAPEARRMEVDGKPLQPIEIAVKRR